MLKSPMLLIVLLSAFLSKAQTKLYPIFKNHMVLQQQQKVSIWGEDKANTPIKITTSWGVNVSTITNNEGKWKLKIQTPSAGGPHKIFINGTKLIALQDVMIGEVWLCSGQSNMEMPIKGFHNQPVKGSQEEILNSKNNNIRMYTVKRNPSLSPVNSLSGDWKISNPNNTADFSAVAYFFGKKLESALKVPIGLIVSCWGGSSAEAWTDLQTLKEFKTITIPEGFDVDRIQQTPTSLYNGMIHPLLGYSIKGCIWYQGETNRDRPSEYSALINAMVTSWRKKWNQGDFPFYTTQTAPISYGNNGTYINSAYLREAQLKTSQTLKNTGMAITLDIAQCDSIHPPEKKIVGTRLAYIALAKDYAFNSVEYSGPVYKSMRSIDETTLELTFSGSKTGITSFGKEILGFEIAGEDQVFYPAIAIIGKEINTLLISSPHITIPVAVRYNFNNCAKATLFSTSGLPASSFRTDNW
ncbi:sialate O-acetylesterase [Wenyingzhuangia sp. chi5]|uniref:Sialate O-acetylesterase n=1 Tax=Wenyingzhuangia gilva TaxID=3057677 RepID=A0ABT8VMM8_9FLAO|nr:sialate O-acetylesterase [Wenyingzhuangia sp. chi5]MDO3693234.1 sialate O-acetylesterase [Wenyingzhuangia sp. chi5]